MTFKKVCIIGLKILVTAAAGVAVWISLNNKTKSNNTKPDEKRVNHECENHDNSNPNLPTTKQKGAEVVSSLRKFQDTCGKIFSVAQSIAVVGENLYRIFNNGQSPYQQNNNRFCGGNPGFTRVTANIIEAGWNPNSSSVWGPQQNKFCF